MSAVPSLTPTLVVDQKAELGEGPIWDSRRNKLLWLDILASKLFEYDPVSNTNTEHDLSELTNGHLTTVVPVADSASQVVVGVTQGVAKLDLENPKSSFTNHPSNGNIHGEFVRMNDGKCDPQGRLWIGSIAREGPGGADLVDKASALYVLDGWESAPVKVLSDITVSNGIVWTPDAKTMYYIDSPTFTVSSFDFDGAAGAVTELATNRKAIIEVATSFPPVPDGCALDTEGMLWVACFGGQQVRRYDPASGEILATVDLPAEAGSETTACAFGGEGLDELYVTTAHEFWDEAKRAEMPLAGGLFKVAKEELGKLGDIRGVPMSHFRA